jgi:hypothetical protein
LGSGVRFFAFFPASDRSQRRERECDEGHRPKPLTRRIEPADLENAGLHR